jgi:tRNA A-37 threonylcarbamoyl transferase component Bud32
MIPTADGLARKLQELLGPEFTVLEVIGQGAMGVVFRAREHALDRHVAVKVLRPERTVDARARQRFERESRLLARVDHPNVLKVLRAQPGELPFYVTELVTGESLEARLSRGPLTVEETRHLGQELLAGLGAIHAAGIVHRDLKPANILLPPGRCLIADFGIAKADGPGGRQGTATGVALGTTGYMPPEQALAEDVGPPADLYAIGVILYQCLTGQLWLANPAPRRAVWAGIPRDLAGAIRRGVAWESGDRWPDPEAFRAALTRRRGLGIAVTLLLGGLLGGALVWVILHRPGPEPRVVDLAISPFEGCRQVDSLSGDPGRYVVNYLEWFPQWRVAPLDGGPLRAARRLDGDLVCGRVTRLLLRLRDSTGTLLDQFSIEGPNFDPLDWGRLAADSVVTRLWPEYAVVYRTAGGPGGRPRDALLAYFAGERAFQRDAWLEAERHYRDAILVDSTFALAAWRMAVARKYRRVPFEDDLRALYLHQRDRLPELPRLLTEAQLIPDVRLRLARYEAIVGRFPRDGYAALELANEAFARGPLAGVDLDSAIALFRQAAARDPYRDKAPALTHEVWGAIRLGREQIASAALDQQLRIRRGGGEDVAITPFLRLAYHERFNPALGALFRWWEFRDPDSAAVRELAGVVRLAITFDLPASEAALARVVRDRARLSVVQASAHEAMGLGLFAQGRADAAFVQFDSAATLFTDPEAALEAAEWRVVPAVLGLPTDSEARERGRRALAADWPGARLQGRAAFALAIDGLAQGDTVRVRLAEATLSANARTDSTSARLALLLAAWRLGARGDPAGALALSAPLMAYDSTGRLGGPFARAAVRLARARWWVAARTPDGALTELIWWQNSDLTEWPRGVAQAGEVDAAMSAYARFLRARIGLAGAVSADGCAEAARVGELWRQADEGFTGLKAALDSLRSRC